METKYNEKITLKIESKLSIHYNAQLLQKHPLKCCKLRKNLDNFEKNQKIELKDR